MTTLDSYRSIGACVFCMPEWYKTVCACISLVCMFQGLNIFFSHKLVDIDGLTCVGKMKTVC